jgi:hypothetical protein
VKTLFWSGTAIVAYTYLGYPLVLLALGVGLLGIGYVATYHGVSCI